MEIAELKKLIKEDFRQTEKFANFLEIASFKPFKLKNNSFIYEFNFGKISIIKSMRNNINEETFDEISDLIKNKYNLLCKFSPNLDYDETLNNKYKYFEVSSMMTPTKTVIKDLTVPIDEIYESFSENTRYKINRSIREGDRIDFIQSPNNLQMYNFINQLKNREKTKHFVSYTKNELNTLKNCFWQDSFIINSYTKNNIPVVSNFYIRHKDKVTYVAGSLNSEQSKSKAGFQMIFEAFKFFKNLGVKVYDFEGLADERNMEYYNEWLGFSEFKLKFSNEIIYYPQTIMKYNNYIFDKISNLRQKLNFKI